MIASPLERAGRTTLLVGLFLASVPMSASTVRAQPPASAVAVPTATPAAAPVSAAAAGLRASEAFSMNPLAVLSAAGNALPGGSDAPDAFVGPVDAPGAKAGGLSTALNIVVLLTVISLAPSIMLMTTCFVRITVVLGLLKQALGTQNLPPAQVTLGLSLFMTLLVMSPTLDRIHREAIVPYRAGDARDYEELWSRAKAPIRDFMFDQIDASGNWTGVYTMLQYRGIDTSAPENLTRADVDMVALVPAYMLSELKVAFLMGFRVYLPFLVIDMVIASLLISMGMMMLPPVLISLPFKLLLFVLVDGWALITGSLMSSFVTHAPAILPAAAGG